MTDPLQPTFRDSESFIAKPIRRPKVISILSFAGWSGEEIAVFSRRLVRMARKDPGGFVYSYPNPNYTSASTVREIVTPFPDPPRRVEIKAFFIKAGFSDGDAELIVGSVAK